MYYLFHYVSQAIIVVIVAGDYWQLRIYEQGIGYLMKYANRFVLLCFVSVIVMYLWDHDDVINWKHFPRYWPFVRGIHRSPVNSPHKGQWRGALMFTLICVWINGCVNNGEAGDLRRYCAHYGVTVMCYSFTLFLLGCLIDAGVICSIANATVTFK